MNAMDLLCFLDTHDVGRCLSCLPPVVEYEQCPRFWLCRFLLLFVVKTSCIGRFGSFHDESGRCCCCLSQHISLDFDSVYNQSFRVRQNPHAAHLPRCLTENNGMTTWRPFDSFT